MRSLGICWTAYFTIYCYFLHLFDDDLGLYIIQDVIDDYQYFILISQSQKNMYLSFTVFGNTGLHMVLNGEVSPITHPYLNVDNGESLRAPTPLVINEPEETVSWAEILFHWLTTHFHYGNVSVFVR